VNAHPRRRHDDLDPRKVRIGVTLALLLAVAFVAAACSSAAQAATPGAQRVAIPEASVRYRAALHREAAQRFGLAAPVARLAAQLHQESGWRPDARSPFAEGLAQFTPATAEWIAGAFPRELAPADTWDPAWSIRALVIYDAWLLARVRGATDCDRWAKTLAAYNGGLGWIARDERLAVSRGADAARWFGHVEHHTARAAWAAKENRGYPRRILLVLEPAYIRAGWPGSLVC
jgi:soluble lytic murein transglycosylase-like protein